MHHTQAPGGRSRAATHPRTIICGLVVSALGLLGVLGACSEDSATAVTGVPPTRAGLLASVTAAAEAAVGADGRMQLAAARAGGAERELTAAEAGRFASVYMRHFAPRIRGWLEKTHGAPINFMQLRSCGRPLYARSAFNPPPENISLPLRRVYGPWWLLTFCDGAGSPSVSLAVSAWATDLAIVNGRLRFPPISGAEFVAVGIPAGHVGEYPSAPEAAIELGARRTGRRVSRVPELVTPMQEDGPPQLARWRLTLEGPVALRTGSGARSTDEVFVSPASIRGRTVVTSVAAREQPAAVDFAWSPAPVIGEQFDAYRARARASLQVAKITRRADTPVRVEPITGREDQ
jgi:hypothetical protein